MYRKSFRRIFPPQSLSDFALSLDRAPGVLGLVKAPTTLLSGGRRCVCKGEEGEEGRLVDEVLSQQPEDWKLNVTLSKSPMYPVV